MVEIGREGVRHDFATAFVKAIFGGWMIALMVWLMPSAHSARFAVMSGPVTWGTFLTNYAVPVLLGNSIGGIVFVAALNHAQVAAGEST